MAGEPAPDRGILEMAKHFYIQKGARKQEDMERRSPKTKAWNSKFGAGAGHYSPPTDLESRPCPWRAFGSVSTRQTQSRRKTGPSPLSWSQSRESCELEPAAGNLESAQTTRALF